MEIGDKVKFTDSEELLHTGEVVNIHESGEFVEVKTQESETWTVHTERVEAV